MKSLIALMLLAGFVTADAAENGAAARDAREADMEVVLVRGEQPGPALWKVSSADHVLWILGEVLPIPGRVKWRSKKFEKLLSETQEVLIDDSDVVPEPEKRRDLASIRSAQVLPPGQTLQEFISPEMYARALAAQQTFNTPGRLESLRPWAAASRIYFSAVRSLDLVEFSAGDKVTRLARKAKVRITTIAFKPTFAEHIGYLESGRGDDCLVRIVGILGDGGSGIRRLANAWSTGDIEQLRELVPAYALINGSWGPNEETVCYRGGPQRAGEFFAQRTAAWLNESERVLRENRSTMAVMPIGWLLDPGGYVTQLRARGYEVEEPE